MSDRIGQEFGSYRLARLLGQGGFADVYLAKHQYLDRQAAIKILHTRLAQREQEAFLAEARVIADLKHPNIVHILDFGVAGNEHIPFLVMEYAAHGSLRQRYPQGARLPLNEVTSYVKQIASALQYAHERKVIHRDVKPENMLIGDKNEILLGDFGIAVVAQNSRSGQDINGTVAYMAPEQLQGKAQPASDQYALAICAYELLCGEAPFKGSFAEVGSQHLFAPLPPLRERVPHISADVESVINTALSKEPQRRFGSVHAFANALEQASLAGERMTELGTAHPSVPTAPGKMAPEPFRPLTPPPPPGVQPIPTLPAGGSGGNYGAPTPRPPVPNTPSGAPQPGTPGPMQQYQHGNMTPQQGPSHMSAPVLPQGNITPQQGGFYPSGAQQGQNMTTPQTPLHLPRPPHIEEEDETQVNDDGTTQSLPPPDLTKKPKTKPKKKSNALVITLVTLVILLLLVSTSSVLYAFVWQGNLPWVPSADPSVTTTQITQQETTTPDLTATTGTEATATAEVEPTSTPGTTPTASATPKTSATATATIPPELVRDEGLKNYQLVCVSTCETRLKVVVTEIKIDVEQDAMTWIFNVTNNGTKACSTLGSVKLADQLDNTISSTAGTFDSEKSIAATQSLPLTLTFPAAPKKGEIYLMESYVRCGSTYDYFRTEQFKFNTGK